MRGMRSVMAILSMRLVPAAAAIGIFKKIFPDQYTRHHHHLLGFTIY